MIGTYLFWAVVVIIIALILMQAEIFIIMSIMGNWETGDEKMCVKYTDKRKCKGNCEGCPYEVTIAEQKERCRKCEISEFCTETADGRELSCWEVQQEWRQKNDI